MRTGLLPLRRLYRYIPTALTLGNSLLGFSAILYTLHAYAPELGEEVPNLLEVSAWMIVFAMVFDMLDGWAARLLNAKSLHGMQMDSLADMVTFGVAPAVLVAVMAHTQELDVLPYLWVWVLCATYLGCVALRLALYNVIALSDKEEEEHSDDFHGLPSPGAAAAVCSLVILHETANFNFKVIAQLLPFYAAMLGFLMVSPIPYTHVGHWLGSKRRNTLRIFLLIVFFVFFSWDKRLVAAIAINAYVLSGPVKALWQWLRSRRDDDGTAVAAGP